MPENGFIEPVEVLYGASVLPILIAPQAAEARPMKLLREVSAPLTELLWLLFVSVVPEVAEMSICVSSW